MAKEIVPNKLIITLNEDWSVKDTVLSYRMREDGAMDTKRYFTIAVDGGIDIQQLNGIIESAKAHANAGEKITEGS